MLEKKIKQPSRRSRLFKRSISNPDDKARLILVVCASLVILVSIMLYAQTRDSTVLLANTPIGMIISPAFKYYFPDNKK